MESQLNIFATKEDLAKLSAELKEEIAKLRIETKETKSEIIKWMFIFWISQAIATYGFILTFLKK